MKYAKVVEGKFKARPNRFIAQVEIDGKMETVHVKNTGRCGELLVPDAEVCLAAADNPQRKTKYDLVAVKKSGLGWVNIDSQAPNNIVEAWLATQNCSYIKREFAYDASRLDFYFEKDGKKYLLEVKGCTLEIDGQGYFPDAPTQRGTRHLRELIKAQQEGYHGIIAFVIQMPKVKNVLPNDRTDKKFTEAFYEAKQAGIRVLNLTCDITPDSISIKAGQSL